ncbi:MAG: ABC transporter ATP-binding protein [Lachnospiraceae bacterium]|nr:ABC transporter ATP-binding protein [Lachnospiraceae bacterium]
MIKIRDLKTSYSYGDAFTAEELELEKGEVTSIIGKNGCGKTTLLRTIAGLLPYEGSVLIDDTECRNMSARERAKKAAYLPQLIKPVSLDVQTLVEHGRYPWHGNNRRLSDEDKVLIDHALDMTKMNEYRKRDLTELSGGQLRRAYLAMVIAQNADMILLDEPTTFMDIESQALFYEIAKDLAKNRHGIIMTCHNIEQGFSCSDKIILMGERCIRKTGAPKELVRDKEELRSIFGAAVKEAEDKELLYQYILTK